MQGVQPNWDPRSSLVVQLLVQIPNLLATHHSSSRATHIVFLMSSRHHTWLLPLIPTSILTWLKILLNRITNFLIFEMCIPFYMAQASMDINKQAQLR
jgi:hypothetical protein